jgi:hypothetical protein
MSLAFTFDPPSERAAFHTKAAYGLGALVPRSATHRVPKLGPRHDSKFGANEGVLGLVSDKDIKRRLKTLNRYRRG